MMKAAEYAQKAKEIFDFADSQGRPLHADEKQTVEQLLESAETAKSVEGFYKSMSFGAPSAGGAGGSSAAMPGAASVTTGRSAGEMFTLSPGYKSIADASGRGETWSSGLVDTGTIPGLMMKGTLLEGSGAPGSGSGGGLVPVPQVTPGVVTTLFQRLTVENLLLGGVAEGNTVRTIVEGTATSAAAGVAEGGTKPESTLGYGTTDEKIKKIANVVTISDELLEDAQAVQQLINSRLSLFVQTEVERQLLRGSSGGTEVQGLLTSRNIPVMGTASWASGDSVADKLFKAMNNARGSFIEPDWVMIHPTDYQTMRLLKDGTGGTQGQYYGGGPFLGGYGNVTQIGAGNQVLAGATDSVWGKPCYVTTAIGSGTALVGTYSAAQVWSRGGLSVEIANQHASYFTSNLCLVRAERRLGLSLYRSGGFVEVHLNTA